LPEIQIYWARTFEYRCIWSSMVGSPITKRGRGERPDVG
jgi:hypothetical protein